MRAATTLFAEHGVGAVGVRRVAAAAGENTTAINYHFGGKDGLWRAVVERAAKRLREGIDAPTLARADPTVIAALAPHEASAVLRSLVIASVPVEADAVAAARADGRDEAPGTDTTIDAGIDAGGWSDERLACARLMARELLAPEGPSEPARALFEEQVTVTAALIGRLSGRDPASACRLQALSLIGSIMTIGLASRFVRETMGWNVVGDDEREAIADAVLDAHGVRRTARRERDR